MTDRMTDDAEEWKVCPRCRNPVPPGAHTCKAYKSAPSHVYEEGDVYGMCICGGPLLAGIVHRCIP